MKISNRKNKSLIRSYNIFKTIVNSFKFYIYNHTILQTALWDLSSSQMLFSNYYSLLSHSHEMCCYVLPHTRTYTSIFFVL